MTIRTSALLKAACAAAAFVLALAPAAGEAGSKTAAASQPGISGDWGHVFGTPGAPGPAPDPKLLPPPAPPPPLKPEFQPQYDALRAAEKAADAKGEPIAGNSVSCLPDGMPAMMFAIYPLEILQTPGQVTVIEEAYSQVRHIYLDKPQAAVDDVPPGFFGHSVGHWEGATLVVDTIGIKDAVPVLRGVKHSPQLKIDERIHLVAPDVLHDDITITDPATLTGPWSFTYAYKRLKDYEMLEYVCENNREYTDDKGGTHLRLEN